MVKRINRKIKNKTATRGTRKNRNRRKRRTMRPVLVPRTLDGVVRGLTNMNVTPANITDDKFMLCRLNPFLSNGGVPIPDAGNSNFMVIDLMAYNDITTGTAGNFYIQTIPCLPTMALGTCLSATTSTFTVDGIAFNGQTGDIFFDSTKSDGAWVPLASPLTYSPTQGAGSVFVPGVTTGDAFSSTKARLISVGYRLFYTGPATAAQGVITVTPSACGFSVGGVTTFNSTTSPPAGSISVAVNIANNTRSSGVYVNIGTPILQMDCDVSSNIVSPRSRMYRPEQGCLVIPQHKSKDYKIQPTTDTPYCILTGAPTSSSAALAFTNNILSNSTAGTPMGGGVVWFDQDWESFLIAVTGAGSGATYRLETIGCFEFTPSGNSAFSLLTRGKSVNKPAVLNHVENIGEKAPVGPLSSNTSVPAGFNNSGRQPRGTTTHYPKPEFISFPYAAN